MTMQSDTLLWLQQWYQSHTNGDWEHRYGVQINTIDNPGWRVEIDLAETGLANNAFVSQKIDESDLDWVHCRVEQEKFILYCGPFNLKRGLDIFRTWVESSG